MSLTWDDILAGFTPAQVADADASVAAAPDFTGEQFHKIGAVFTGAGERLAETRRATAERGAA